MIVGLVRIKIGCDIRETHRIIACHSSALCTMCFQVVCIVAYEGIFFSSSSGSDVV